MSTLVRPAACVQADIRLDHMLQAANRKPVILAAVHIAFSETDLNIARAAVCYVPSCLSFMPPCRMCHGMSVLPWLLHVSVSIC